jgi:hypothetical protein
MVIEGRGKVVKKELRIERGFIDLLEGIMGIIALAFMFRPTAIARCWILMFRLFTFKFLGEEKKLTDISFLGS